MIPDDDEQRERARLLRFLSVLYVGTAVFMVILLVSTAVILWTRH
jgi:hypothetical protein